MSICPKNKSSKARRDSQQSELENERYELSKVQQVRSSYDAPQSVQGLRFLQQARDR